MSRPHRQIESLELGGIALVDILANSVAAVLVLIALRLGMETEGLGQVMQDEKTSQASLVLARRIAQTAELSGLPVSHEARLHDYQKCDAKRANDPLGMPTIELHANYVLIRDTGVRLDRQQLLVEPNPLDLYLQALPEERQTKLRCDVFDIQLYYIAISILIERGFSAPSHWHFVAEDVPEVPAPVWTATEGKIGSTAVDLNELLANLQKRAKPAPQLLLLGGFSAPQKPAKGDGLTLSTAKSARSLTFPAVTGPIGHDQGRSAHAADPAVPAQVPSKRPAPRSLPGGSSAQKGTRPGAAVSEVGTRKDARPHESEKAPAKDQTPARNPAGRAMTDSPDSPVRSPSPSEESTRRQPDHKNVTPLAPAADNAVQLRNRPANANRPEAGDITNFGNFGDAIILTLGEDSGAPNEEGSPIGFSIRTYQTGLIAALPESILRVIAGDSTQLHRADEIQMGAGTAAELLEHLIVSVNLAAEAMRSNKAQAVKAASTKGATATPANGPISGRENRAGATAPLGARPAGRKPTVVYIGATWSEPCRTFQRKVLPEPAVQRALARVTFVRHNADVGIGTRLARSLKLSSFPTVIALADDGKELSRIEGLPTATNFVQWLSTLTAQRSASTRYSDKRSLSARTTSPNMIRMVTDEQVAEARRLLPLFDGVIKKLIEQIGSPRAIELHRKATNAVESTVSLATATPLTEVFLHAGARDVIGQVHEGATQLSLTLRPHPFPVPGFRLSLHQGMLLLPAANEREPGLRWRRVVLQDMVNRLTVTGYILADLQAGALVLPADINEVRLNGLSSLSVHRFHPRLILLMGGYLVIGIMLLWCILRRRQRL